MQRENGLQSLRSVFGRMADVPEAEWAHVSSRLVTKSFGAGEFLIRAGEPAPNFFFIIAGLTRFFYLTSEGKEFNKYFAKEHDFVGSLWHKVPDEPCPYSVQALENTETVVMPASVIEEAYSRHAAWERIGRLHAEKLGLEKELREKEFLLDTSETRYQRFLHEYPGLARRLPQYHIASYLGITDVALSRIRHKAKN